uniref:Uncharacterized protein n=1 Tax=Anguilla anguilla TaxID=7936 RepID=A0A0E9PWE2_ANGAN
MKAFCFPESQLVHADGFGDTERREAVNVFAAVLKDVH